MTLPAHLRVFTGILRKDQTFDKYPLGFLQYCGHIIIGIIFFYLLFVFVSYGNMMVPVLLTFGHIEYGSKFYSLFWNFFWNDGATLPRCHEDVFANSSYLELKNYGISRCLRRPFFGHRLITIYDFFRTGHHPSGKDFYHVSFGIILASLKGVFVAVIVGFASVLGRQWKRLEWVDGPHLQLAIGSSNDWEDLFTRVEVMASPQQSKFWFYDGHQGAHKHTQKVHIVL